MARDAVLRCRALALAVEVVRAHTVRAGPWLGFGQPTRAPEAVGAVGARTDRLIVVRARAACRRDWADGPLLARVRSRASEARRRACRVLVGAAGAFEALSAPIVAGICALAALSWRNSTTGAPVTRGARFAARLIIEVAPIVGEVRALVARRWDPRARAGWAHEASPTIGAICGAGVGLVRRLRAWQAGRARAIGRECARTARRRNRRTDAARGSGRACNALVGRDQAGRVAVPPRRARPRRGRALRTIPATLASDRHDRGHAAGVARGAQPRAQRARLRLGGGLIAVQARATGGREGNVRLSRGESEAVLAERIDPVAERRGQLVHERAIRAQIDGVARKLRVRRRDPSTSHHERAAVKRAAVDVHLAAINGDWAAQQQPVQVDARRTGAHLEHRRTVARLQLRSLAPNQPHLAHLSRSIEGEWGRIQCVHASAQVDDDGAASDGGGLHVCERCRQQRARAVCPAAAALDVPRRGWRRR